MKGSTATLELSPVALLVAALIIFLGAVVKGATGFGFNIATIPVLLLFLEPRLVPVIVLPLSFVLDIAIIRQAWRYMQLRLTAPMIVLGIMGIPLGTYVLLVTPAPVLKLVIASVILVAAVLMLAGFNPQIRRVKLVSGVVGFSSGVLATSTGISAPPVALLLMNQRVAPQGFRPSLASFLMAMNLVGSIAYGVAGAMTRESLTTVLALLPAVLLGFLVASRLVDRINPQMFRRVTLAVVIAAAASALATAIAAL